MFLRHSLNGNTLYSRPMKVNEIFYSLQGEGTWTGLPNIFIRTTGCNLRCSYCDTQYAYDEGTEMTIDDIIKQIKKYPCMFVCFTGGEPLLQQETPQLLDALLKNKYTISVETNGSIPIKPLIVKPSVMISLDIKCPSSQMQTKMTMENIALLRPQDQLKFIIQTREDYDYAKTIIKKHKPQCTIFFQPAWKTDPTKVSTWILNDGLPVKLGVQLQKLLFGEKRGT